MKKSCKVVSYFFSCLIIQFLFAVSIQAQVIDVPSNFTELTEDDGLGGTIKVFHATIPVSSTEFNVDFNRTGGGAGAEVWNITSPVCNPAPCPSMSIDATGFFKFVPNNPMTMSFNVTVSVGGGGAVSQLVRITIRRAIDLVLVLDKSGSMSTITTGTTTRWTALVTAVNAFVDKFEAFRITGDRISITYFHSVVENGLGMPGAPFIDITPTAPSSKTQIGTSLSAHGPASMTAMGLGLVDAKDKLAGAGSANKTKIVLLFTDGIQNWPPPPPDKLVDGSGTKLKDNTPINIGPGNQAGSIKIYTIGLGDIGSVPAILAAISGANRGVSWVTQTGADVTSLPDFTIAFANMLSQFSPQILGTYRGAATGVSKLDSTIFTCNQSAEKLLFEIYATGRMQVAFEKDGKAVAPTVVSAGQGYQLYTFRFPHADPTIKPGGKWKVKMLIHGTGIGVAAGVDTSRKAFGYTVIAITDDHSVDYTSSLGAQQFKPGDDFKPSVTFSQGTKAITDGHILTVILKPGQTLGHLIATTDVSINPPTGSDTSSAGIRKYEQLLSDPAFLAKMLPKEQTMNLSHTADGNYSGGGFQLDTSGVYRVIFFINDTLSNGDIIQRREEQTLYVPFDEIDLGSSQAVLTGSGTNWVLTIKPMTKQKLFVGPAFHQTFGLTGSGIVLKNVIDVGDGSYQLIIEGDPNANVDLTLLGAPVYKGKLSGIGKGDSLLDKIRAWLEKYGIPEWLFWLFLILLLLFIIWLLRRKR